MAETQSVDHLLQHAGWVRRLARSLVGDASQADDLCQETWVRALEHPPADAGAGSARSWLATVMRNALRQRLRGDGRRREREDAVASFGLAGAGDAEPVDEVVGRAALHRDLVDELMQLDEPFRTALLLRYFEGLAPAAIAARDGVSLATAKSRLTRGLEKLRERLDRRTRGDRARWMAALAPLAWPLGAVPPGFPTLPPAASAASSTSAASAAGSTAAIGALVNLKLISIVLAAGALAVAALTLVPNEPEAAAPHAPATAAGAPELERPDVEPARVAHAAAGTRAAGEEREALAAAPAAEPTPVVAPAPEELHVVRGRVIDVASNPLPGVEVVLESGASGSSPAASAEVFARTRSELGGRFELASDRAGGRVVVRDERWVTVLSGGFARQDVVVVAAPRIDLAGRVIDGSGRGVAGAAVGLVPPETLRASLATVLDWSADVFFAAATDAEGRFELAGVPAVAGARITVDVRAHRRHEEAAPQQTLRDLVIVLEDSAPGPRILRGRVVDAQGAPVADARVSHGLDTVTSGEDGGFEFDLDDEASFNLLWNELAARHMGPEAVLPEADEVAALAVGHLPGSAKAAGRTADGVPIWPDLVVIALGGEPLAIEGVVIGRDGEPLAGATVWIGDPTVFGSLPTGTGSPRFMHAETLLVGSDRTWNSTEADEHGRFRIEGLLERDYVVCAMDPRTLQRVDVTVAAGTEDVELVLPVDGLYETLRGRVLSLSGEPLPGVSVHGMSDSFRLQLRTTTVGTWHSGSEPVLTDAEGRFELADVPRDLVYLRLDSERTIPLEWGRHVEGGLATLVGDEADALEIRLSVRCHFQVELDDPARADRIGVLDGEGETLEISEFRGPGARNDGPRARLVEGRSATLAVGEEARTLVLYRAEPGGLEREVARVPLSVSPLETRTIRP